MIRFSSPGSAPRPEPLLPVLLPILLLLAAPLEAADSVKVKVKNTMGKPGVEMPAHPEDRQSVALSPRDGFHRATGLKGAPWFAPSGSTPPVAVTSTFTSESLHRRAAPYGTASFGFRFTGAFDVKAVFRNTSHNGLADVRLPGETPENVLKRQITGGILFAATLRF